MARHGSRAVGADETVDWISVTKGAEFQEERACDGFGQNVGKRYASAIRPSDALHRSLSAPERNCLSP